MIKGLLWMVVFVLGCFTFVLFGVYLIPFITLLLWLLFFAWAVGMPIPFNGYTYHWFKKTKIEVDPKDTDEDSF